MIKEHTTALALAKQLNLAISHDADVEDMKYTLTSLLEAGIKNASQTNSTHSFSKKVRDRCVGVTSLLMLTAWVFLVKQLSLLWIYELGCSHTLMKPLISIIMYHIVISFTPL
jgi:hypothetical protein